MEDLTKAIRELTKAINKTGILAEDIKPAEPKAPPKPKEEKPTPKITFEDLRAVLAVITRDGKQQKVKDLITKYDAKKLSDVPEDKYQELLDEARKI